MNSPDLPIFSSNHTVQMAPNYKRFSRKKLPLLIFGVVYSLIIAKKYSNCGTRPKRRNGLKLVVTILCLGKPIHLFVRIYTSTIKTLPPLFNPPYTGGTYNNTRWNKNSFIYNYLQNLSMIANEWGGE